MNAYDLLCKANPHMCCRVRTDSSSDTDRGPIWLNLDWTRSEGVDRPSLTITHVNGNQFVVCSLRCLCILNSRLVAYNSIFYLHVKFHPNVIHIHHQHLVNSIIYHIFGQKNTARLVCKQTYYVTRQCVFFFILHTGTVRIFNVLLFYANCSYKRGFFYKLLLW